MANRPEETRAAIASHLETILPDDTAVEHTYLPYYGDDAFYRIESRRGLLQVHVPLVFLEDRDPDEACELLARWDLASAIGQISSNECVLVTNDGLQIVPLQTGRATT